jgi:hypothetical protein
VVRFILIKDDHKEDVGMRNAILVSILTGVLLTGAAAVNAGPPVNGTWSSTGGAFDEGTAASTWAAGGFLGTGNVLYGQSYAGGVFTADWSIGCPVVSSVITLLAGGPTGNSIYQINYVGGYVTLGGPGNPWNGGDAVYTGIIDTYTEIRTVQTVSGHVRGAVSDHSVSAHIQGYSESCVAWAIGNGVLRGATPGGSPIFDYSPTTILQSVKAANYPAFHLPGCAVGGSNGHWDDIKDLTVTVQGCAVATEQSTWGNVKAMYRN